MNRKNHQPCMARAAMMLLAAMLSVAKVCAEVVSIGTVAEWNDFASRVNSGETLLDGLLTADLDFRDQSFTVAGTGAYPFCGTFDGASHTLTGINVSKSGDVTANRQGVFGSIGSGGVVKNVTVTGSSFAGWDYVGGIAGYNQGGTVSNCHVTSSVTIGTTAGSKENHGGIVGYNSSIYSTVSHCTSGAVVTNSGQAACHYFGGVVGNNSGGTVEYCIADNAMVSAVTNSGAIVGSNAGNLSCNYYGNCSVGEATSNLGTSSGDVTTNNGALPAVILYDKGTDTEGNSTTISGNSGSENNVVLSGRSLVKDGNWNTLCLPFPMTAEQIAASDLSGAVIKELDNTAAGSSLGSDGTLTLKFVTATSIEAGKPYIVRWENSSGSVSNPVFERVTIASTSPTAVTSYDGTVTFTGTYGPALLPGNVRTNLYMGANNTLYYPNVNNFYVNACRAYFQLKPAVVPEVKAFVFEFEEDDQTTSVNEELRVKNAEGVASGTRERSGNEEFATAAEWFDMQGRRLSGKPARSGICIVNGKKVIVR